MSRVSIIGAGIPALALAVDLLQRHPANGDGGLEVQLHDLGRDPKDIPQQRADQRTTAFLPPSVDYLDSLGVWAQVATQAAPLETLRIIDDRGARHSDPLIETFRADEFGQTAFAHNVANAPLRLALIGRAQALGAQIAWQSGFQPQMLEAEDTLLIAADGQNSGARKALGIALEQRTPNQSAIVCNATHSLDQNNVSCEFHRDAGPFTLVPFIPDPESGRPRTAIVWVEAPQKAAQLKALPAQQFCARLQTAARGLLGEVFSTTPPQSIPVATQSSTSMGKPGALLMAEAAHALPPIGAQGLNTSMGDAMTLGALSSARTDWVSAEFLAAYEKARKADIGLRFNATDMLNKVTTSQSGWRDPLSFGVIGALRHVPALRQGLVRKGLGL